MVDMYVLVVCDLARTEEIASDLRAIDEVKEVHMLNGAYDIIVKDLKRDLIQGYNLISYQSSID